MPPCYAGKLVGTVLYTVQTVSLSLNIRDCTTKSKCDFPVLKKPCLLVAENVHEILGQGTQAHRRLEIQPGGLKIFGAGVSSAGILLSIGRICFLMHNRLQEFFRQVSLAGIFFGKSHSPPIISKGPFTQAIFVAKLNAIFVAPKLHQVSNMFHKNCIELRELRALMVHPLYENVPRRAMLAGFDETFLTNTNARLIELIQFCTFLN